MYRVHNEERESANKDKQRKQKAQEEDTSGIGERRTIADVVERACAMSILPIKWHCPSFVSNLLYEFVMIAFVDPNSRINGEEGSTVINAATATDTLARLNLSPDDGPSFEKETAYVAPLEELQECTCGMPLCICQLPSVTPVALDIPVVTPIIPKKLPAVSSAVKRVPTRPSYGNELPSLFFSNTKSNNVGGQIVSKKYESTGEGIWEAIKNGDAAAVKDLLATFIGCLCNYWAAKKREQRERERQQTLSAEKRKDVQLDEK
ncbi:hypothetical protein L7F22_061061 [Adiantum nelumboides]|nr:hypothetical protein [Adiantum nelumboides]